MVRLCSENRATAENFGNVGNDIELSLEGIKRRPLDAILIFQRFEV
jgi:hypothetical protein